MPFNQSNPSQRPTGFSDPRAIYAFVEFLAAQFAKTIEVYFRKDFGQRYFGIGNVFGSILTFGLYLSAVPYLMERSTRRSPATASAEDDSWILGLFFLGFVALGLLHQIAAWLRQRRGQRWHSRYSGTSHLAFLSPGNPYIVQRYIEPGIAFVIGWLLFNYLNRPLGAWLIFASFCLAATEAINAKRARNRILDAIDAQIEAKHLGEALAGNKDAEDTEGFVLPVPKYFDKAQRAAIYDGMVTLDPALAAIMDMPEGQPAQSGNGLSRQGYGEET
jgi:hypothetical protein